MVSDCVERSSSRWRRWTSRFPLFATTNPVLAKWISLIVACLGMSAASAVWQNSWQNGMRAIFNQTETEANLVFTLGSIGANIGIPSGLMFETYGTQANMIVGIVLSSIGYFILAYGTGNGPQRVWFSQHELLVAGLYFLVGASCSFVYIANFIANASNFEYGQRGKVFGLLDSSLSVGPTLLTILYNADFASGHLDPGTESQQNLSGYFAVVGIFCAVSYFLNFIFVGEIGNRNFSTQNEYQPLSSNENGTTPAPTMQDDDNVILDTEDGWSAVATDKAPNDFAEFPFQELSLLAVIFRWNFLFLVAHFILSGCLQIVFQSNIPTFLRSYGMNEYNLLFTSLSTGIQAFSKFGAGLVSDMVAERGRYPRTVVFIVPYILQTLSLIACIWWADNFYMFLTNSIILATVTGITWCQTPTIMGELFGIQHLGSNWGFTVLITSLCNFPLSLAFSSIYESWTVKGEIYCYGQQCFTWSFVMLAGMSFCSLIMATGLTQNMYRNAYDRRRVRGNVTVADDQVA